jgi:uncharacterized protein YndB with AHSA1/START domain
MATSRVTIPAAPADVFAVLADARSYERWLVGCKRVRAVDEGWPAPGTKFHHRVGIGLIEVADYTEVVSVAEPTELVLRARARPLGTARVSFSLEDGPGGTLVVMEEAPVAGLAARIHNPLIEVGVAARNRKSLRNLQSLVGLRTSSSERPPRPPA